MEEEEVAAGSSPDPAMRSIGGCARRWRRRREAAGGAEAQRGSRGRRGEAGGCRCGGAARGGRRSQQRRRHRPTRRRARAPTQPAAPDVGQPGAALGAATAVSMRRVSLGQVGRRASFSMQLTDLEEQQEREMREAREKARREREEEKEAEERRKVEEFLNRPLLDDEERIVAVSSLHAQKMRSTPGAKQSALTCAKLAQDRRAHGRAVRRRGSCGRSSRRCCARRAPALRASTWRRVVMSSSRILSTFSPPRRSSSLPRPQSSRPDGLPAPPPSPPPIPFSP